MTLYSSPRFIHDGLTYTRHLYQQIAIIPSPESLDYLWVFLRPKSSHVTTANIHLLQNDLTTDHEKRHGMKQT